jgi:hypothetical protein
MGARYLVAPAYLELSTPLDPAWAIGSARTHRCLRGAMSVAAVRLHWRALGFTGGLGSGRSALYTKSARLRFGYYQVKSGHCADIAFR